MSLLKVLSLSKGRNGFNGLHALAAERLGEDPRSGGLFVFCNRRRTRLKMLYFDGTGLWVLTKRLEEGTFSWPKAAEAGAVKLKLTTEALAMPKALSLPKGSPTGSICAGRSPSAGSGP